MKLSGLSSLLEVFSGKKTHLPWGMTAKAHCLKPKPATPARKRHRKTVQASQRRNRR